MGDYWKIDRALLREEIQVLFLNISANFFTYSELPTLVSKKL